MWWNLNDALELIRNIQPDCMNSGYYIALAGGVLNGGGSINDLDLVAVPRAAASNPVDLGLALHTHLGKVKGKSRIHNATIIEYKISRAPWDKRLKSKIEVVVIDQPKE